MKYRKKPQVIEALQWTGKNYDEMLKTFPHAILPMVDDDSDKLVVRTLKGTMLALPGDYLYMNQYGVLSLMLPDIFENNYERME